MSRRFGWARGMFAGNRRRWNRRHVPGGRSGLYLRALPDDALRPCLYAELRRHERLSGRLGLSDRRRENGLRADEPVCVPSEVE